MLGGLDSWIRICPLFCKSCRYSPPFLPSFVNWVHFPPWFVPSSQFQSAWAEVDHGPTLPPCAGFVHRTRHNHSPRLGGGGDERSEGPSGLWPTMFTTSIQSLFFSGG